MPIGNLNSALSSSTALNSSVGSVIQTAGGACDIFNTLGSLVDEALSTALKAAETAFQNFVGGLGGIAGSINDFLGGIQDVYNNITDFAKCTFFY